MNALQSQYVAELAAMSAKELAGFWNICQFQRRFGSIHENEGLLVAEMKSRGFNPEIGKKVKVVDRGEKV